MHIGTVDSFKARKKADVLVVPFWKEKAHAIPAVEVKALHAHYEAPISAGDFQGREGETCLLYVKDQEEPRFLLLGLGGQDDVTVERLRRAFSSVTKVCQKHKLREVNVLTPQYKALSSEDLMKGVVEGLLLPNYTYTNSKRHSLKNNEPVNVEKITLVGVGKAESQMAEKFATIVDAVYMARDLVNGNADDVTPQHIEAVARGLEKSHKNVTATIFDKQRIKKEGMGLLLAVNRGSSRDPAFVIVEYKGNPKSKEKIVLVGKGITFDTGGLNLKPTGSMETMREDMAGAAAVLATVHAVASLELKVNVTAVVPSTENSIDALSYKPGDVYVGYSGKSVEIGNTDAEGRLVLADALAYCVDKLNPTYIVSIATLTGAIEITLGNEASGLFTTHDALADLLAVSGSETGERVWRLPMYEEYKENLKSDIADIKSTGGRPASSINAATFLQEFVGDKPWVHLDIAGTAFLKDAKRYLPKHATGVGVRLLVSLVEKL